MFYVDVEPHCSVLLRGVAGNNVYTIHPSALSHVTIADFKLESDVLDLRAFASIRSFRDINMTRGSVRIHLPDEQNIVLLDLDPIDMSAKQFYLVKSSGPSSSRLVLGAVEITLAIIIFGIGLYLVHRIKSNMDEDVHWELADVLSFVKNCWRRHKMRVTPEDAVLRFDMEKELCILPKHHTAAQVATSDSTHSDSKDEEELHLRGQEQQKHVVDLPAGAFTVEAFDELMSFSDSDEFEQDDGSEYYDVTDSSESDMYASISSESDGGDDIYL